MYVFVHMCMVESSDFILVLIRQDVKSQVKVQGELYVKVRRGAAHPFGRLPGQCPSYRSHCHRRML